MNPLVSTKPTGRLLMALAAISSLFLTVGCGSSGSGFVKPNPVGFSNSSLSGTYVFSSSGVDAINGSPLVLAGALVADGKGGINSGGTMDVVDPELTPPVLPGQAISGGSYNIGSDGRGSITLTSSAGGFSFTLDVVLTSTSHGLVTEFDGIGTGSGTLDLQTALTGISQLGGPYAFSLAGADSNAAPFATEGAFTLNSSGGISAGTGVEDFNAGGIPYLAESLTGGATLGTGTGPGTITFTTPAFSTLTFDYYPIDATHLKLIETDDTQFLSGDVFTQSSTSITATPLVFTMAGGATVPIVLGGLVTTDPLGNLSNGLEDVNDNGTVSPAQLSFGGTAGSAGIGGRVVVALNGSPVPASSWVIYPFSGPSGSGLLILEADANNITIGAAYAQSATSFAASNYGLNLTGANTNGLGEYEEVDDIAQFDATAATTNNMTGALSENDEGNLPPPSTLSGAYTPDSPATGRGSISVTTPNTFLGGLTLEYYVADSSTVLFMEGDQDQFSTGTFELQTPPSSGNARSHIALARPAFLKPAVRARLAARRKK
jgi:hypothetical protein